MFAPFPPDLCDPALHFLKHPCMYPYLNNDQPPPSSQFLKSYLSIEKNANIKTTTEKKQSYYYSYGFHK